MIKATGRHFSDFLQSVDNIHLQMRFTYPKMKSPSMYISHMDRDGVVLVYRSSRRGFTQYFTGKFSDYDDRNPLTFLYLINDIVFRRFSLVSAASRLENVLNPFFRLNHKKDCPREFARNFIKKV